MRGTAGKKSKKSESESVEEIPLAPLKRRKPAKQAQLEIVPPPAPPPPLVDTATTAQREMVTPEWARHMLANNNPHNRPILGEAVNAYATEMASGEWESWIPIAIDLEGAIADGQHRLSAVVQYGKPVSMLVLRGVPSTYKIHIDRGRKRTPGFQMQVAGFGPTSLRVAAVVRQVALLDNDGARVSDVVLRKTAQRDRDDLQWAIEQHFGNAAGKDPIRTSPVIAAFVYAYPVEPEKVNEFATLVTTRANIPANSAAIQLDEYVRNIRKNNDAVRRDTVLRTLRAIHSHIQGKPITRLTSSEPSLNWFRTERARIGKL